MLHYNTTKVNQALLLVLGALAGTVATEGFPCPRNNNTQSTDRWALFRQAFPDVGYVAPVGNPFLGNQNYTYCCILAVNEYLNNGCVDSTDVQIRGLTLDSQFPCGATWKGDPAGAPLVEVSYLWSEDKCPGWQKTSPNKPNQWLQLLVGFLLPDIVFCLNIPRRRKIQVWNKLFPENIDNYRLITAASSATLALLIVVLDTIIWLFVVFAVAGPLLLSGLYEARLDKRVVSFIDDKEKSKRLPVALRARMLFTILSGNLDLYLAWSDTMYLANALDTFDIPTVITTSAEPMPVGIFAASYTSQPGVTTEDESDVESVVDEAATMHQRRPIASEDSPLHSTRSLREAAVGKVSTRLSAMLSCQYSFGSTVGAPVLFYVGSFIYSILEVRQTYGDTDIAYALSFGMWWMVIPHAAIVSGFLLGGNNPYTLEGIMGNEPSGYHIGGQNDNVSPERRQSSTEAYQQRKKGQSLHTKVFGRVYEAAYKPASMWNRGRSKQSWLLALYADTMFRYRDQGKLFSDDVRPSMQQFLSETMMFGPLDWVYLGLAAIALVAIPCAFGFCLSFFTPQVGIACRSLTLLLYACAQTLLTIVWMIRTTWRDEFWCQGQRVLRASAAAAGNNHDQLWMEIERLKQIAESRIEGLSPRTIRYHHDNRTVSTTGLKNIASSSAGQHETPATPATWQRLSDYAYYLLLFLGLGTSIFTALGGTLLQMMGVYRNNICKMNVVHWLPGHRAGAALQLSSNSSQAIAEAKGTWTILGSLSVAFLIVCCYIGWWYQKRLRSHFKLVASRLDPQD